MSQCDTFHTIILLESIQFQWDSGLWSSSWPLWACRTLLSPWAAVHWQTGNQLSVDPALQTGWSLLSHRGTRLLVSAGMWNPTVGQKPADLLEPAGSWSWLAAGRQDVGWNKAISCALNVVFLFAFLIITRDSLSEAPLCTDTCVHFLKDRRCWTPVVGCLDTNLWMLWNCMDRDSKRWSINMLNWVNLGSRGKIIPHFPLKSETEGILRIKQHSPPSSVRI